MRFGSSPHDPAMIEIIGTTLGMLIADVPAVFIGLGLYILVESGVIVEYLARAHGNGEWEHTTVVQGSVTQVIGGDEVLLQEGETIRYAADQPHGLRNDSGADAKILLVVIPMKDLERHNIPHGPIESDD